MFAFLRSSVFGAGSDQQVNKQDQAEAFENEDTLIGATLALNKRKVLKLLGGNNSRLLEAGPVGENAFHMCFLFPDPKTLEFGKWLLTLCPELITSGTLMLGCSCCCWNRARKMSQDRREVEE